MNTRLLTFLLTISLALAAVSAPPTYVMSPVDGYQGTKEVEGPLLFYDNGGPNGKTKTAVTGYKIFKAANEGESLTLTFQSPVNFSHYLTHIYIYEGDCRYAGGVTGSPDGWKKKFQQDILQISPTVVKARLHFLPEFVQCSIIVQPTMKQGQVGRLC